MENFQLLCLIAGWYIETCIYIYIYISITPKTIEVGKMASCCYPHNLSTYSNPNLLRKLSDKLNLSLFLLLPSHPRTSRVAERRATHQIPLESGKIPSQLGEILREEPPSRAWVRTPNLVINWTCSHFWRDYVLSPKPQNSCFQRDIM